MRNTRNAFQISAIDSQCAKALAELAFTFSRSQGPGGQNVNKVNSKATIRWSLENSSAFSDEQKDRIRKHPSIKNLINQNGEIIIAEQGDRSQLRNRKVALEKLTALLKKALEPITERVAVDTPDSLKKKIFKDKKHNSSKKHERRWKSDY